MSVDSAHREVAKYQSQIALLQERKSRELGGAADASKKAADAEGAALRASSNSIGRSKARDAQRYRGEAIKHQKEAANIEAKISVEQRHLREAQKRLLSEENREASKRLEEHKRSKLDGDRKMRALSVKLSHQASLQEKVRADMDKLLLLPEKITVLFLAANPRDQAELNRDGLYARQI